MFASFTAKDHIGGMRIAVIADTHNRFPAEVEAAVAGADEIWHLGDVCTPELLADIRGLGPPVFVVRGNCDPRGLGPESLTLTRNGHVFYLIHEPPYGVPREASYALHGHTHVPRDEMVAGVRHLNPGTLGKANHGSPPSYAWLEVQQGQEPSWRIVAVRSEGS